MLRKMCRDCMKKNRIVYYRRELTGEIFDTRIGKNGKSVVSIKCKRCGHIWDFSRRKHKKRTKDN